MVSFEGDDVDGEDEAEGDAALRRYRLVEATPAGMSRLLLPVN